MRIKNVRKNSQGIRTHNCRDLPPFNLFLFSHCTAPGMGLATLAFKQTHYVVGQILCGTADQHWSRLLRPRHSTTKSC